MKIEAMSLQVGQKQILTKLSLTFQSGRINHILGKNGIGKSCFSKACAGLLPYSGKIDVDERDVTVIGSYSNIPSNLRLCDVLGLVHTNPQLDKLLEQLNISEIDPKLTIGKMSDGQKQKIKLLYFLSFNARHIILDEFTSALDKSSTLDVYRFLNAYLSNPQITSLNITHNLSDLEYLPGNYYIFSEQCIMPVDDKDEVIQRYIKGV
ncbi:MAG: ATP-binding cassette domain-containing protein [Clostridiales bacterium]|nr:ATP-binding cassette domain-containing protein [Clostridiales bacterium]